MVLLVRKPSWQVIGRAHGAMLGLTLSLAGCSDGDCSALKFGPPVAVVHFVDESGEPVCELPDGYVFSNSGCRGCTRLPAEDKRDYPSDPFSKMVSFAESCEYRISGWYDQIRDEPIQFVVEMNTKDAAKEDFGGNEYPYQPAEIDFKADVDTCGQLVAREQTITLVVQE